MRLIGLAVVFMFLVAGCAATPNPVREGKIAYLAGLKLEDNPYIRRNGALRQEADWQLGWTFEKATKERWMIPSE